MAGVGRLAVDGLAALGGSLGRRPARLVRGGRVRPLFRRLGRLRQSALHSPRADDSLPGRPAGPGRVTHRQPWLRIASAAIAK